MSLSTKLSNTNFTDSRPPEEVHTVEQLVAELRRRYIRSGIATVANTETSVEVVHGLKRAPDRHRVSVTPADDLGAASKFWLGEVDDEKIVIHVNADPEADIDFTWQIVL